VIISEVQKVKINVIGVNCNQMSEENTLVLMKCFHYCKQFQFCGSVSCLRISTFLGIECKWLVLLGNDGSDLVFLGICVDFKENREVQVGKDNFTSVGIFE
jgi:hypothetical protein